MLSELLDLQKIDSNIDRLNCQIEEMVEKKERTKIMKEVSILEKKVETLDKSLKGYELKQDKSEGELGLNEDEIKKENDKLYSGSITNPKELSDMQLKIKQTEKQKDDIEDELIEIMDKVSNLKNEKETYSLKKEQLLNLIKELENKISENNAGIYKDIEDLNNQREEQIKIIDENLLKEYEDLRKKCCGVAVTELVDDVCQACHVELPAVEIDKMKNGRKNYCPFCERMIKY